MSAPDHQPPEDLKQSAPLASVVAPSAKAANQQKYTPFAKFAFGFNNPKFSDHVLVIVVDSTASHLGSVPPDSLETSPTTEPTSSTGSGSQGKKKGKSKNKSTAEETRIYISSLLLASQSCYFASLFGNGMKESQEVETRMVVDEDEKDALLDVIRFLYEGKFQNEQPNHLLYVLRVADKYAVECAIEESARLLKDLKDSSIETCCMFLDLPDSLQHSDSFAPLLQAASNQLADRFKDLDALWLTEELEKLTARGIAAVLSSDNLQVQTENTIFQALIKWVSKSPERKQHLESLLPLVRLPYMTVNFLRDVVRNNSLCRGINAFEEALFDAMTYHALDPTLKKLEGISMRARETKEIAEGVFTSNVDNISALRKKGNRLSKKYYLGGYFFYMNTKANNDNLSLFLMVDESSTGLPRQYCIPVQYVFSIKNFETNTYDRKSSYQVIYRGGLSSSWGLANFLNLVDEKNQCYIRNDTLTLRAEIKVHSSLTGACPRQWYFRDSKDGVIKLMS